MTYDPEKHHRRSIRLHGYDYSQAGAYFVTICTKNRASLFGSVADGEIQLNKAGQIAKRAWEKLPARFPSARLDAFIVMPNHLHAIIIVGAQFIAPTANTSNESGKGAINRAPTLGEMVRAYKAASAAMIRRAAAPDVAWQRNYYEHVIRDEDELARIRRYIEDNPRMWETDEENPAAQKRTCKEAWQV